MHLSGFGVVKLQSGLPLWPVHGVEDGVTCHVEGLQFFLSLYVICCPWDAGRIVLTPWSVVLGGVPPHYDPVVGRMIVVPVVLGSGYSAPQALGGNSHGPAR